MKFCSIPGCGVSVTDAQAETAQKLFGKIVCVNHEKGAAADVSKEADKFTLDTAPYIKCGFAVENGIASKIIGQAEITVDIAKKSAGKSNKESIQMGGYDYEYGINPAVDSELKILFTTLKGGAVEKKENKPAPVKTETKKPEVKKMTESKTEIVVASEHNNSIVRPAVSVVEAIAAWKEFNDLKAAIISDSDRQDIAGRSFVKKSGWRKLAAFFNLTDKITEEIQMPHPDGGWTWKVKVIAIAPNGRTSEGVGICSTSERKFAHVEHDTYATAHTRAKNRAISDMIAGGEVSAEEVD